MYYEDVGAPQFQLNLMSAHKMKTEESARSDHMTMLHNPVIPKMHVHDKWSHHYKYYNINQFIIIN